MRISFGLLAALAILITSCGEAPKPNKRGHSGAPFELVVVMEKDHWESEFGKSVRRAFGNIQYGLPQNEPLFDVTNVNHEGFTTIFQYHRNVLMIEVEPEYGAAEVKVDISKSAWAKDQLVVRVKGKTREQCFEKFETVKDGLVQRYIDTELDRLTKRNKKFGPKGVSKEIKDDFGITLTAQKDFTVAHKTDSLFWLYLERTRPQGGYQHQILQGMLVHSVPYTDTAQLNPKYIMALRDSVNGKTITGEGDDAYMGTYYGDEMAPQYKEVQFRGQYALEIRGLWCFCEAKSLMGGPFMSVATLNPAGDRLYILEAYAYAPQFDKRFYLREVEAMVRSVEFPGASSGS